tara:strand:+ start:51 stop:527 length:477 start_codon:yes stop_codon:yes gene_type:complete
MHIVTGQLRKAPFVKVLQDATMFAVELSEMIKDYKTGEKVYTNYSALLFAKSEAHVNHYNNVLVEGNFIVLTSEKLKIEVSQCGKYTKLQMDNARLENSNFIQGNAQPQQQQRQQAPQQQQRQAPQAPQYQQQAPQQQQQQRPQQAPQAFDYDDDLAF